MKQRVQIKFWVKLKKLEINCQICDEYLSGTRVCVRCKVSKKGESSYKTTNGKGVRSFQNRRIHASHSKVFG
jgi:hypothetical protein